MGIFENGTGMTPDEVLKEAERVYANGNYLGADRVLAGVWADTTNAPPAVLHLLGCIHAKTRDFRGGEQFFRRAIKASPNEARHHAALADLLSLAGHFDHAAASYAAAEKLDPKLPRINFFQGLAAFNAGRFADTEKIARAMLAKEKTSEAWDMLSVALREQGKYKDAAAAAEEALKFSPTLGAAAHSRAAAWTFLGRDEEALSVFETLSVQGVLTPALWYFRSRALINLKRHSEAAGLLADGIRRWPDDMRLRATHADLLKQKQ